MGSTCTTAHCVAVQYKWLDLLALKPPTAQTLEHGRYPDSVLHSGGICHRHATLAAPDRQQAYLRAQSRRFLTCLSTTGQFQIRIPGQPPREKGSDVNLASYLLLDAFDREYQVALVISNDSDLTHPIELVRDRFGVRVGVAPPVLSRRSGSARGGAQAETCSRQPTFVVQDQREEDDRYSATPSFRTSSSTAVAQLQSRPAGKRDAVYFKVLPRHPCQTRRRAQPHLTLKFPRC